MRVKFSDAWEVRVNSSVATLYPRGWTGTVPDEIAEQAIEDGKAESMEPVLENELKKVSKKASKKPRKGKSKK